MHVPQEAVSPVSQLWGDVPDTVESAHPPQNIDQVCICYYWRGRRKCKEERREEQAAKCEISLIVEILIFMYSDILFQIRIY